MESTTCPPEEDAEEENSHRHLEQERSLDKLRLDEQLESVTKDIIAP